MITIADETLRSTRQRAYDRNFKKTYGEVADFAGRALVAAGLGGGIIAKLAQEKAPRPAFGNWLWR